MLRPYLQRVPVLRFTPTVRHAALLLIPAAIRLTNSSRCSTTGSTPDIHVLLQRNTKILLKCCDDRWSPP